MIIIIFNRTIINKIYLKFLNCLCAIKEHLDKILEFFVIEFVLKKSKITAKVLSSYNKTV